MLELEELTNSTIGAAMKVQSAVGPGLLESAYRACLARELALRGHAVAQEVSLEVQYEGLVLPQAYRMDLVIDGKLVVELKTVERLSPAHEAQLLTYLRFSGNRVGLLFNFWSWPLKDGGIKRLIHTP